MEVSFSFTKRELDVALDINEVFAFIMEPALEDATALGPSSRGKIRN